MKSICSGILFLMLAGCAALTTKHTDAGMVIAPDQLQVKDIELAASRHEDVKVVEMATAFENKYAFSKSVQRVRFLKARALENQELWTQAAETYQAISAFAASNQPEISALSVYRLSFVYESLGDDQRVLTTLFEAQKYADYLPTEISYAEIPSRLAMVYAKENNGDEAQRWLKEAEKGLKKTLESKQEPLSNAWLAEIYYDMGSISTQQLSAENILTIIQGQKAVQKYLIRALQYGDAYWSEKALHKLQETYRDLWNVLDKIPEPTGVEPIVAQKMKKDEQFQLAGPFSDLIAEGLLYRPGPGQKRNGYQKEFFQFLEEMQKHVNVLLQSPLYTPLTSGREKPSQRKKTPVNVPSSQDPNL